MVALNQQWAEEVFSESAIRATQTGDGAALPFSFVYGGQHSSSLVGAWECQVQDETVDATHDEPSPPVKMSGAALQRLSLAIDECPGSLLVEYRRIGGKAIRS